ncbi:MAG TPA: MarR family transcriptional regulator [Acidimicrobiales bacterium]|jgi:DNA-binding MarR family transcriptional regulator|nr:MarR family transcriptional regulator [Acidimicrobiales bacterium]
MGKSPTKLDLAADCFRLLTGFLQRHKQRFLTVASDHGLTPAHLGALMSLEPGEGQPMRALAELWHCDASNVTWLVDRLEERGLVARQQLPTDRRVKSVALTSKGEHLRSTIDHELTSPPEPMLTLTLVELAQLTALLQKLSSDAKDPSAHGSSNTMVR